MLIYYQYKFDKDDFTIFSFCIFGNQIDPKQSQQNSPFYSPYMTRKKPTWNLIKFLWQNISNLQCFYHKYTLKDINIPVIVNLDIKQYNSNNCEIYAYNIKIQ